VYLSQYLRGLAISIFLTPVIILEFDSYAAEEYGGIRVDFEKKETSFGLMDMPIAGQAEGI